MLYAPENSSNELLVTEDCDVLASIIKFFELSDKSLYAPDEDLKRLGMRTKHEIRVKAIPKRWLTHCPININQRFPVLSCRALLMHRRKIGEFLHFPLFYVSGRK